MEGAFVAGTDQYRYNGKELQTGLNLGLYDYGARFYDPTIGRFTGVDALADHPNQVDKSPYAYAWNNPINLTDPDGNCPKCAKALVKTAIKSVRKGKLDLGEVYDVVDNGSTLFSSNASLLERGEALFNLASPVSTKDLSAAKKAILKGNKAAGKKAEKLVTSDLKKEFPNDEVLEQVTGKFGDGTTTRFDNVVIGAKTGKP